jgi:hypothetical protein
MTTNPTTTRVIIMGHVGPPGWHLPNCPIVTAQPAAGTTRSRRYEITSDATEEQMAADWGQTTIRCLRCPPD